MTAQHEPVRTQNGTRSDHPKQAKDAKDLKKAGFLKHDLNLVPLTGKSTQRSKISKINGFIKYRTRRLSQFGRFKNLLRFPLCAWHNPF
jgi:hypothetical protein